MCHEPSSSRTYEAWNSQKDNVIVKDVFYVITISRIWCVHVANEEYSDIEWLLLRAQKPIIIICNDFIL